MVTNKKSRMIPVGDPTRNTAVGEYHHRAILTDEEVEAIRQRRDDGEGWKKVHLDYKDRISASAFKKIFFYQRRNATVMGYRRGPIDDGRKV